MKRKTIFIVPGYKHKPSNKAYKIITSMLKSDGHRPISVSIPWKQTTISENTEYFLKKYKRIRARNKYILGFSFGAMIAFLASTKVSASGLILCSMSPYFKEDLSKVNSNDSVLRRLRYEDFSKLNSAALAKEIKAKQILMMFGDKEEKSLIKRVTKTYRQLVTPYKRLITVRETDHNIGNKRYLHSIHHIFKTLH